MANKEAAKKYLRASLKRAERNRAIRSAVRTYAKKVLVAVASGSKDAAMEALKAFEKNGMKSVTKKVFHINTIARRISRLYKRVKAIS